MPPQHETEAFCLALKAARKRRGLTLESIAEATKVCVSYYTALEANDLRRWPKGLFRRSFFRGYVEAIGLPVEQTIEDFVRLFPEDDRAGPSPASSPDAPVRLALDQSWHGTRPPLRDRLMNAVIDGAVVFGASAATAFLSRLDLAMAAAIISLTYFTLATLVFGETPASWLRKWLPTIAIGVAGPSAPEAADAEMSEDRRWISDARRVRPRETTARLRVRFKSSH